MAINIRQVTSLEKVRLTDSCNHAEISRKTVLKGERFSYQLCMTSDGSARASVTMESELADYIRLYHVKDACMDCPVTEDVPLEDYITHEPGLMPDILIPIYAGCEHGYPISLTKRVTTLWIKVDIPENITSGKYFVTFRVYVKQYGGESAGIFEKTMEIEVIEAALAPQKLIYTRWFYVDCIANIHQVDIYSEKHWKLIDRYIAAAADVGINMILVPVHTPPLDTEVGTKRPCVQLVEIEKIGDSYQFSFEKFRRFIAICKKHKMKYYEIAHMFSQWGAEHAPNIVVSVDGKPQDMFGWHTDADSQEYVSFLKQYIRAICEELKYQGISENTYFHISDEPDLWSIEKYRKAAEIIRPLIGTCKSFDAISNYKFYETGLVECPVTSVSVLSEFLEHKIENQWAYYCCGPQRKFTNSFMAMPSYRTRILGFLLYRYDVKGFLHWGFNFYNNCRSLYQINPYLTTSADKAYPSGDPFIVYPGKEDVYPSIRGEVTYEAVQDIDISLALEKKIGREAVINLIDEMAGGKLQFEEYPKWKEYPELLREKMIELLR